MDRQSQATLSHLALSVGSLELSTAFYQTVFGFEASPTTYTGTGHRLARLMEVPGCEIRGVFLSKGAFFMELLEYQPAGRRRNRAYRDDEIGFGHLSFIVEDVVAAGLGVERAGGEMHWDTKVDIAFGGGPGVTIAFCLDPDGNRIELVEHPDSESSAKHAEFLGSAALGWPPVGQPARA